MRVFQHPNGVLVLQFESTEKMRAFGREIVECLDGSTMVGIDPSSIGGYRLQDAFDKCKGEPAKVMGEEFRL